MNLSKLPINYEVSWLLWKSSSPKWPQHKSVSIPLISRAEWSAAVKSRYRTARKPTPPLLLVRNQVCTLSRTDLQLKADLFRHVQVLHLFHLFTSLQWLHYMRFQLMHHGLNAWHTITMTKSRMFSKLRKYALRPSPWRVNMKSSQGPFAIEFQKRSPVKPFIYSSQST